MCFFTAENTGVTNNIIKQPVHFRCEAKMSAVNVCDSIQNCSDAAKATKIHVGGKLTFKVQV